MFAQVQHQIATSQISLKALPGRKESSPGCYGQLQMQIGAESTVRGLCGWSAMACYPLRPRGHKNAPRVVNITPAMDA